MSLNHCRTAPLQFILQRTNDLGMVVANVVDAVTGEKIEDPPSVVGEQFNACAPFITHVHLQQVEKSHPLRIHALGVALRCAFREFGL